MVLYVQSYFPHGGCFDTNKNVHQVEAPINLSEPLSKIYWWYDVDDNGADVTTMQQQQTNEENKKEKDEYFMDY